MPKKKQFLLELINNNYSNATISNYARDLFIFELFLWKNGLSFRNVNKEIIQQFKGFLKSGGHIVWLERMKRGIVMATKGDVGDGVEGGDSSNSRLKNRVATEFSKLYSDRNRRGARDLGTLEMKSLNLQGKSSGGRKQMKKNAVTAQDASLNSQEGRYVNKNGSNGPRNDDSNRGRGIGVLASGEISKRVLDWLLECSGYGKSLKEHASAELEGNEVLTRRPYGNDKEKNYGLGSRSINRMLSSLRSFLKYLVEIDFNSPIPPDGIKLLRMEKKESHAPEFDELVSLIESPSNFEKNKKISLRNRAILELLFATGLRISELVALNRDDVGAWKRIKMKNKPGGNSDISTEELAKNSKKFRWSVSDKVYIVGKGKKSRFVYLTERAKRWVKLYLQTRHDDYPALFIPYRGGRVARGRYSKNLNIVRISVNYVQEKIAEYRRRLGIVQPISPHSLRHGFATFLAESGANPAAIQILLGHESLQTTTRYVHGSDRFAEDVHKRFHPLK